MSGILKAKLNKKRLCMLLLCIAAVLGAVLYAVTGRRGFLLLTVAGLIAAGLLLLNQAAVRKLKNQYAVFSPYSKIRNLDCLFVGDMVQSNGYIEAGASFAQLAAPGRGFLSDYELIRHAHSILKDGGSIFIAYRRKNAESGLSLFDYPIFHRITFEKYCCADKKIRAQFPLFFAPVLTIRFLCLPYKKGVQVKHGGFPEIDSFCEERGYTVTYIEI